MAVNRTYPVTQLSLAIWDHTVLPATRHKRTHLVLTPARQAGIILDLSTPEGWKAELTIVDSIARPGRESNQPPLDHESDAQPLHHQDNQ